MLLWIAALANACIGLAGSAYSQLPATSVAVVPSLDQQFNTNIANLPPKVREQLEKQRAAMKALYIEYYEILSGGPYRDYTETNAAYFEGNRFTIWNKDREYSFDGKFAWVGGKQGPFQNSKARLTKFLPSDSSDSGLTYLYWKLSYFDAASIYAPAYLTEVNQFSSLKPLALHYLEQSDATKIEQDGENFRITFYVDDSFLINRRKTDPVRFKKTIENNPNTAEFKTKELETLKRLQSMDPKRTVSLVLDSQHGYAVAERDDRTAAGQRIAHFQTENWKFYEDAGIWLPERCVVSYYATPYTFEEFADQPLQKLTIDLNLAEFGERSNEFAFSETPKYASSAESVGEFIRFG